MSATARHSSIEALVVRAMEFRPSTPVRDAASVRIADVACATLLGARLSDWAAAARTFRRLLGGSGPQGLWQAAALAACCRHTEVDDIDLSSCTTPGSVAVPSALVCAQVGAAPDSCVDAVVAAYEVCVEAAELLGGAFAPARGLWPTRAVAPVSAAVGAARAMDLGTEEALDAAALAASTSVTGTTPEPARAMSLGVAVAAGVAAAVAASEGMKGDRRLVEQWTASRRPGGPDEVARDGDVPDPTGRPRVLDSRLKPYAGARQVLAASAGLRRLVDEEKVAPNDVRALEVAVPPPHAAMVDRPDVRVRLDTLASAQYQLATALTAPEELDRLDHGRPPSPQTARRMATVSVRGADELAVGFPERWGARLRIHLGTEVRTEELDDVPGELPFDWERVEEKARRLAPANGVDAGTLLGAVRAARSGDLAALAARLVEASTGELGGS